MKIKYISLTKPIQIIEFEEFKKPMGWIRLDSVLKTHKEDLTKEEIKQIKKELELE